MGNEQSVSEMMRIIRDRNQPPANIIQRQREATHKALLESIKERTPLENGVLNGKKP